MSKENTETQTQNTEEIKEIIKDEIKENKTVEKLTNSKDKDLPKKKEKKEIKPKQETNKQEIKIDSSDKTTSSDKKIKISESKDLIDISSSSSTSSKDKKISKKPVKENKKISEQKPEINENIPFEDIQKKQELERQFLEQRRYQDMMQQQYPSYDDEEEYLRARYIDELTKQNTLNNQHIGESSNEENLEENDNDKQIIKKANIIEKSDEPKTLFDKIMKFLEKIFGSVHFIFYIILIIICLIGLYFSKFKKMMKQ
jgi:hypothetical protein